MASIMDYDNDGMVDLMSHGEKEIYVFWNALKAATNKEKSLCKTEKEVMVDVSNIFPGLDSTIQRSVIPVDLPDFKQFKTRLRSIPSRLRVGDINLDGYPDIIGQYLTTNNTMLPFILINHGCT